MYRVDSDTEPVIQKAISNSGSLEAPQMLPHSPSPLPSDTGRGGITAPVSNENKTESGVNRPPAAFSGLQSYDFLGSKNQKDICICCSLLFC